MVKVLVDVVYNHTSEGSTGTRAIVVSGDTDGTKLGSIGDDLIVGGAESHSYDAGFRGGVYVAVGEIDGAAMLDGAAEFGAPVVGAGGMVVLLQDGSVRAVDGSLDLF